MVSKPVSPTPYNFPLQGQVDAAGDLVIRFGPPHNQTWEVRQITIEMPTAPAGATCEIRYMASLIAPSPSAKRASAGGDPPIFLQGGETMSVEWAGCTVGDFGRVLVVYNKGVY